MGIYIKGMEMPTSCMDCPLEMPFCDLWTNEKFAALKWVNRYEERHPDCPLVPVPAHGRLIDADALVEVFRKNRRTYHGDMLCEIITAIAMQPTIIEKEGDE